MAYDDKGAAVGAAGHDAAAIVAALITAGAVEGEHDALALFDRCLTAVYNSCSALKGADAVVTEIRNAPSARKEPAPAGPAGDDPGTVVVPMGKYKGQTIAAIYDEEPTYLNWLADKAKMADIRKAAADFLNQRQ